MNRIDILSNAWGEDSRKFGDIETFVPVIQRVNVLKRRRNKWASESPREQTDEEALTEWLFVLSRTRAELTALFRVPLDEWEAIIDDFMGDVPDAVLNEFAEYFTELAGAMQAGEVEEEDTRGKIQSREPSLAT